MNPKLAGRGFARRRTLLLILLFVPTLHAAIALYARPAMFNDSGWGFLVLASMKREASFNTAVSPDPANIAVDTGNFLTWWSPGQ